MSTPEPASSESRPASSPSAASLPVIPPPPSGAAEADLAATLAALPLRGQVEHVLNLIRPAVQADGGDLELVDVTDEGRVTVRFHGACVGCPSSTMTLQAGIERNLKTHVPAVSEVIAVE